MYTPKQGEEGSPVNTRKNRDKSVTAEAWRRIEAAEKAQIELEIAKAKAYQHSILFRQLK